MPNPWPALPFPKANYARAAKRRLWVESLRAARAQRRAAVAQVLLDAVTTGGRVPRGTYAKLSRQFGVSRATITLDAQALLAEARAAA